MLHPRSLILACDGLCRVQMHLARQINLNKNGITKAILYTINPKSLHKNYFAVRLVRQQAAMG